MNQHLLDYFKEDDMAASTWKNKYADKGENTPDDMHKRLAKEFARKEWENLTKENKSNKISEIGTRVLKKESRESLEKLEEFYFNLFKDFKYIIPQGSIMSQLGVDSIGSLSNCFFIGEVEDSYGGIMKRDEQLVQLMKRRAGVGLDISKLRPSLTPTSNAAKSSTGTVSFMERFSNSTREVAQAGRRGALMISIDINHPDVLDFIKIKRDLKKVTGANISVKMNDEFMKAVENDEDYLLKFPVDKGNDFYIFKSVLDIEYNELYATDSGSVKYIKRIRAKELWNEIIESAHGVAEPGILFWSKSVNYSPDGVYPEFRPKGTNPCGEITLSEADSCRLIALNLFNFVENPFTKKAEFNFSKFKDVVYEAMRLSDNLVDLEIEAVERILDKIESDPEDDATKRTEKELWERVLEVGKAGRRTGLGFTALADTLAAMNFKYDSKEGMELTEQIMKAKMESELECSIDMSIIRGSFEGWNAEIEKEGNEWFIFLKEEFPRLYERMQKHGRRNVSVSTIAPTGSVSMLTQTSSGVEPVFMISYKRRRKVNPNSKEVKIDFVDDNGDSWEEFNVVHHKFKDWVLINTNVNEEDLLKLNEDQMKELIDKSPYANSTANEIDWQNRVKMQGILQKYVTHSISSTINLPEDVKTEEVDVIYKKAWKEGLKGITVYRDGSRSGVLVSNETKKEEVTTFHDHHAPRRPKRLFSKLVRFNNNKEKWIAFVGLLDGKPYEIFTGRLEDIKIPHKIETGEIVKVKDAEGNKRYDFEYEEGTLEGIDQIFNNDFWNYAKMISGTLRHGMPLHFVVDMVTNMSFPDDHINTWKNGVARTLKKFVPDGNAEGLKCYDCGDVGNVVFEEGCMKCKSCGSSKCG